MTNTELATFFLTTSDCTSTFFLQFTNVTFYHSLFNLATKLAFLVAAGVIISSTDEQIYRNFYQETDSVNHVRDKIINSLRLTLLCLDCWVGYHRSYHCSDILEAPPPSIPPQNLR